MKNEQHAIYTYKHRKIVMFLADKYVKTNREKILEQVKLHDLDKLFMYMFYEKEDVSKIHRMFSTHHDNEMPKTYEDYVEMVLDWESARYTKPDKPLNAYDTLIKYYPYMQKEVLPILEEFNIACSSSDMEQDVVDYARSLTVTPQDIKEELQKYIEEVM